MKKLVKPETKAVAAAYVVEPYECQHPLEGAGKSHWHLRSKARSTGAKISPLFVLLAEDKAGRVKAFALSARHSVPAEQEAGEILEHPVAGLESITHAEIHSTVWCSGWDFGYDENEDHIPLPPK